MTRMLDVLLSADPAQRARLSQALLAMGLMAASVLAMHYFVWVGAAPAGPLLLWSVLSLGGMAVAYGLIRSGWSQRFADPTLTVPQMVYALASGAVAYALVGAGRGGVFPIVMVILMFGMFVATPRQMRVVSLYAVLLFGATMALMAWFEPQVYQPAIEVGHFLMVATMVPAVSILAGRLSRLRQRSRQQRAELTKALERIRQLATHDELTGLINRRHMHGLMEQEHQRCIRSGQTFCLAVLNLDHFGSVMDQHGHDAGDELLRGVAQAGLRSVRVSDVLARSGGDVFVLLTPDTRAPLARGGLERLREQIAAMRVPFHGAQLQATVSAGLAEHHAGETVAQTLQRRDRAVLEAKAQGRNRVVVAA